MSALQLIFPKKIDFEVFILLDCHLQIFLLFSMYYLKVMIFNKIGSHVSKSVACDPLNVTFEFFFVCNPIMGFS